MKELLLIAVIAISANIAAFGQKVVAGVPVAGATPQTAVFTRERFDPKRDPAPDLTAAMETAAKTGKRIILDVGGEWCGWCVYMDKFFFLNPDLLKLRDDNFVWVKVNMSEENENKAFLAPYPVPEGYPHLYVLDENGKLVHSQDTSPLESGQGYHLGRFTQFLNDWAQKKAATQDPAVPSALNLFKNDPSFG